MNVETVAPSEKHLEAWIVQNPHCFGYRYSDGSWTGLIKRVVARQYTLHSGILDLLIERPHWRANFNVVELKVGDLGARALAQVLRYMGEITHIATFATVTERAFNDFSLEQRAFCNSLLVSGTLVGASISDPNILLACEACHIMVLLYEYRDGSYVFRRVDSFGEDLADDVAARSEATEPLFTEFHNLYVRSIAIAEEKGLL